jgi:hypothetical protein
MRLRLLPAVLVALSLPVAALVFGTTSSAYHVTGAPCAAPERSHEPECCQQEARGAVPKQRGKTAISPVDPERQIVFKVGGLACPAVKGIGCGHMLEGLLASLDKVDGVGASSANYTGTLIRVSVASESDRSGVAKGVRNFLAEQHHSAILLAADELKRALDREEWRDVGRIGELSAIEFRTLAFHRIKAFAKAEKLNKKTGDKLLEMAEQEWARIKNEARNDGATRPEDWRKRVTASLPVFVERAKKVLTAEQVERLQQRLTCKCCDGDCPEAPPAPVRAKEGA